jgi:hypothetical protein
MNARIHAAVVTLSVVSIVFASGCSGTLATPAAAPSKAALVAGPARADMVELHERTIRAPREARDTHIAASATPSLPDHASRRRF